MTAHKHPEDFSPSLRELVRQAAHAPVVLRFPSESEAKRLRSQFYAYRDALTAMGAFPESPYYADWLHAKDLRTELEVWPTKVSLTFTV